VTIRSWRRAACRIAAVGALCVTTLGATAKADDLETSAEKDLGRLIVPLLTRANGIDDDPLLAGWVQGIGANVATQSPRRDLLPRFVIVGSDVANALTLPGGTVMVTRGLLDSVQSDDELASVLAHETAHVARKHAVRQFEGNLIFAALDLALKQNGYARAANATSVYNIFRTLNKSREQEAQADDLGIQYAYASGYDPNGLAHFIRGFDSGRSSPLMRYLATHPAPADRIEKIEHSPLVRRETPELRTPLVKGLEERGLPGLAEMAQRGEDPLAFPARRAVAIDPSLTTDRALIGEQSDKGRKDLMATYRVSAISDPLQQILLINNNIGDLRWAYLAARAYSIQNRADDLYARTLRVLRFAPATYDALAAYVGRPTSQTVLLDSQQGREELQQAVRQARAATGPLRRGADAVIVALVDLNNHYLRPRGNSEPWLRYSALEGTLRYAESELSRADKYSGQAWRLLAVAQIRNYQARLTDLVPDSDEARRALWRRQAERRFGGTVGEVTGLPTGDATVRAALAVELAKTPAESESGRGATAWADWALQQKGTPENIATAMRILSLDLEREIAAEDRYGIGREQSH